ncbi:hypothetical protein EYF80_024571 [Liparis tanakae]|uniref:Uncharacterized protein n=1 Tax=Liparis tanakae TaxID=230148 RepID=A0A4Z2HJQ9_9TELE|nr:hypothetical protein EYF80_024571 [Liparis tanakae]
MQPSFAPLGPSSSQQWKTLVVLGGCQKAGLVQRLWYINCVLVEGINWLSIILSRGHSAHTEVNPHPASSAKDLWTETFGNYSEAFKDG